MSRKKDLKPLPSNPIRKKKKVEEGREGAWAKENVVLLISMAIATKLPLNNSKFTIYSVFFSRKFIGFQTASSVNIKDHGRMVEVNHISKTKFSLYSMEFFVRTKSLCPNTI